MKVFKEAGIGLPQTPALSFQQAACHFLQCIRVICRSHSRLSRSRIQVSTTELKAHLSTSCVVALDLKRLFNSARSAAGALMAMLLLMLDPVRVE